MNTIEVIMTQHRILMIKYGTKYKSLTEPLITITIWQGYVQDDVQKYMVEWPDGSHRMLREDVIRLYFGDTK